MRRLLLVVLTSFWMAAAGPLCAEETLSSRLIDSPHNLTLSGDRGGAGRTVSGPGGQDLCKPCHAPHGGAVSLENRPGQLLWSSATVPVTYELYRSSTADGMPVQPEGKSRLCLSCHDGTIARAVSRMTSRQSERRPLLAGSREVSRASLGRNLADDHPIMIRQNTVSRLDPEIRSAQVVDRRFHLERDDTLHCTTCHDPHRNDLGAFLVVDPVAGQLCTDCHDLKGWRGSVHAVSGLRPTQPERNALHLQETTPRASTIRDHACLSCHRTHSAPTGERLLKDGPDRRPVCLNCHDGSLDPAAAKLDQEFRAPYAHDVYKLGGRHDALENLQADGDLLDGRKGRRSERHVHCADCHAAHAVQSGTHRPGDNMVSNALRGATGLQLIYSAAPWDRPSYRYMPEGATFEYEICAKCHSYWSWGSFPPAATRRLRQTDVTVEFNPNNASYHAVIGESRAGSRGVFVNPWRRNSKMYCSDCHGSARGSKGAHGSSIPSMLRGTYSRASSGGAGELCANCHDATGYARNGSLRESKATGFSSDAAGLNLHVAHAGHDSPFSRAPIACMDCHVAVPHGWNRKALIAFKTDPEPYADGAAIDNIPAWPAAGGWQKTSCQTGCHK